MYGQSYIIQCIILEIGYSIGTLYDDSTKDIYIIVYSNIKLSRKIKKLQLMYGQSYIIIMMIDA